MESDDDDKEDDDEQPKKGSRAEAIANSKAERVALMTSKRVKHKMLSACIRLCVNALLISACFESVTGVLL